MLIALANLDGSFTCTLFMKSKGKDSFESIKSNDDLIVFFEHNFNDLIPLIKNLIMWLSFPEAHPWVSSWQSAGREYNSQ